MSKKAGFTSSFAYDCNCGKHFMNVGEAVNHINQFRDHHLVRVASEK